MTQQVQQWQGFAGTIAENYDRYLVPTIFEPWADALVDLAAPRPGERVLDVACGPGVVARLAARRTGPRHVTGLDVNPGMLHVARSAPSGDAISWEHGSAVELPFEDGSFDLLLCQQGLQFFSDRRAALGEMRRVLATGGRIALSVWGSIERSPGFRALAAALDRHVGAAAGAAARSPFTLSDPGELRRLLAVSGLHSVDIRAATKTLRFPPPAEFVRQYVWSSPIGATLADADDAALEPVIREVGEVLAPHVRHGSLWFPIENHTARAVRV